MGKIDNSGDLNDEIASGLKAVVENFKATGAY